MRRQNHFRYVARELSAAEYVIKYLNKASLAYGNNLLFAMTVVTYQLSNVSNQTEAQLCQNQMQTLIFSNKYAFTHA